MRSALIDVLARRSILLLVGCAMLAVTAIGLAGMSASVVVAETVQGSASAINVAGSLRRLVHRAASLVAVDAPAGRDGSARVRDAVSQFESSLVHPALLQILGREPDGVFAATYRGVEATWRLGLKPQILATGGDGPPPPGTRVEHLLGEIDAFVAQLNTLVAVLEHDTERRIEELRRTLAVAIVLTVLVVAAALLLLRRRLLRPLGELVDCATRIARGDFAARAPHTGRDELGRVGAAFNLMAGELSKLYRDLELRVEAKTAELQRSNRALEVLYHAIARLYHAPDSAAAYDATLRDIEQVAGFSGSLACIEPRHDGPAAVIATTLGPCADRAAGGGGAERACALCRERGGPHWSGHGQDGGNLLQVPLRDSEHHYGMLRLALPPGARLADWQQQLVEALSRHIGMALGSARRSEQERLLALQEERSVIARELHDSLAQALSYMKIQASLLQPVLGDPARAAQAAAILADLRAGISDAYRQLRELLVSFRLKMSGDLPTLLRAAVEEYADRGGVRIALDARLADCRLTPNQEIHVLHIVREALSNMVRHARAGKARVEVSAEREGEVSVVIDDDGVGIGTPLDDGLHHHGLVIMRERARSLGGSIVLGPRSGGGTRVVLRFPVASPRTAAGG